MTTTATATTATTAATTTTNKRRSHATSGILEYLQWNVPHAVKLQLYLDETRGPFVCRAIVQQALSLETQQVLMRLQCTGGRFPLQGVQVWLAGGHEALHQVVLPELRQWAMLKQDKHPDDEKDKLDDKQDENDTQPPNASSELVLTDEFRTGFSASLCRLQASPWQPIPPSQLAEWERASAALQPPNDKKRKSTTTLDGPVTPDDLERFTQTVWDSVLHFLVGTDHAMEPPAAVVHFLLQTGLMQTDPDYRGPDPDTNAPLVITEKGYDFMLQDTYQRVWHFVSKYLQVISQTKDKGPKMVKECLLLLLCLSFCGNIGQAFSAHALTKSGRRMLKDLAHFGLLYVRELTVDPNEPTKTIFYPTRVALSLLGTTNSSNPGDENGLGSTLIPKQAQWSLSSKALDEALAHPRPHDSSHLGIIVQTNFQVCAYTTSELHVSMLALFCDVSTIRRLPNMVFLRMTRDSVKAAFNLGIQARQILRFLEKHAHPKLRTAEALVSQGGSPIPANVVDQVWLWDRERGRVTMTLVYHHQCLMEGEFEALYAYSHKHGAHVWSSKRQKLLYLNYDHVERMTLHVRQWRAKAAVRQA